MNLVLKFFSKLCLAGGAVLVTSGCFWDECGWDEYQYESWARRWTATNTYDAYPDSGVEGTTGGPEAYLWQSAYHNSEHENDRSVATTVPRVIHVTFMTRYSSPRLQEWLRGGLFVDPSTDTNDYNRGEIYHQIILDSVDTLPVGSYPFSMSGGAGRPWVGVRYFSSYPSWGRSDTLALTNFSGSITITEAFTKNSGAFAYLVEVEYLPGQKTSFSGTASFDGVDHHKTCVEKGVVVD